jgi:cell wall-associated NlpC family hydrolase
MQKSSILKKFAAIGLCAAVGFSAACFGPAPKTEAAVPATMKLVAKGKQYLGVPYKFGAPANVKYAFDCSSFTQYVFKLAGISLPRSSSAQASVGKKVIKSNLSVGDLVFFKTNGRGISHVAIYAGNNKILHSSSSKGVTIADMSTSYWKKAFVTARRVVK